MAYWNLISKSSNGTNVCAGFVVKLKKQLPLLQNSLAEPKSSAAPCTRKRLWTRYDSQ